MKKWYSMKCAEDNESFLPNYNKIRLDYFRLYFYGLMIYY